MNVAETRWTHCRRREEREWIGGMALTGNDVAGGQDGNDAAYMFEQWTPS